MKDTGEEVVLSKVEYLTLVAERDTYRDVMVRFRAYVGAHAPNVLKGYTMLEETQLNQKRLVGKGGERLS